MATKQQLAGGAVAVAALLAFGSIVDGRGFRRYWALKKEQSALTEKNRDLVERNKRMARELEALRNDPSALERAAREELGYVKPGEIVINLE
ncbi:MAG: FtsB family cell division protein [Myxococcaceae bacterium]